MINHNKTEYKKVRLNGQQLPLLAIPLAKRLFPRPADNIELLYESHNDGSCTIYFANKYYKILTQAINKAYTEGEFAQSNAEAKWLEFKSLIESARTIMDIDTNLLKVYEIINL